MYVFFLLFLLCQATCRAAEDPEQAFEDAFGKEAAKAAATADTRDDAELAAKLLKAAKTTTGDPALLAVLCVRAYDLGIKNAAGYAAALEAANLLAQAAPERKTECQEKVLGVYQLRHRSARSAEEKKLVADLRIAGGKLAEAVTLLHQATPVDAAAQLDYKAEIQAAIRYAESRQRLLPQIEQLKSRLQGSPEDKATAAQLARLIAVELDNPEAAAKYVDATGDDLLKKYILVSAMHIENLPENACLELGKWYTDLADSATPPARPRMLARAKSCYEQFLKVHAAQDAASLAARAGLDRAAAEIQKLLPAKPPKHLKDIIVEALIDGDAELWVTPGGIYWKNPGVVSKPGKHQGKDEPTYVNGEKWMPEWGQPADGRAKDQSKPLALAIGNVHFKLELQAVGTERGRQSIEDRDPIETRTEGEAFVVRIPDHQIGSRWYRFRLYRP
jgi:hypothetical protein